MAHPAPSHLATKDLFRLDGQTIIVSGGAGAVGTVAGRAILESGADVVFVDVLAEPNAETWETILNTAHTNNTRASYHPLDVQSESSITSALSEIRTELRHPIRGLVSCAAISGESDATSYPAPIFRRILDINTTGTFLITRAVAAEIQAAQNTGSIVLIASISGHVSNRGINTAAYNASKAAVHQLCRSLAAEWGHPRNTFPGSTVTAETNPNPEKRERGVYPPIRVNTISPGHIDTPLSAEARKRGLTGEWEKQNMLGRICVPEEIRAPVLFLLAEGSSYVTGMDLRVDGGHCAW
ncbi:NAD(P)-binding protein [Stemphylium lycopersici]|uniref:NAD(P)-binding protein n=1 Tax=Stemphylium lycopersici TaxID=183478 RepID=A0A364MTE5_STELY|nr:NAD(P)-binding protein [Stemphylium lycopersici]